MPHPFDPGPVAEPFTRLAADYPGAETYDPERFRTEWGPIFYRGRLDGSARILVLGQDPGQHEAIARRCLVGEAGQRVQGLLWKLGIERSYAIVNAFLYSVYGQPRRDEVEPLLTATVRYRKRWLDALLDGSEIRAVIAFGAIAEQAFLQWRRTAAGKRFEGHFEPLTHPTMPDAAARPGTAAYRAAMGRLLEQWNGGLERLDAALGPERDRGGSSSPTATSCSRTTANRSPSKTCRPARRPGCARSSNGRPARAAPRSSSAPPSRCASPPASAPGNNITTAAAGVARRRLSTRQSSP